MVKEFPEFKTEVDELDLENEQLIIRGRNLCDMIQEGDFTDAIFHSLLNKKATDAEKTILNASLVSFHTGFEAYPPTILFPRIATSLGASVSQALASGYCAAGPLHVGAIERAMEEYNVLKGLIREQDNYQNIEKIVRRRVESHQKLFGFGHPLFKKDPRPDVLRGIARDLDYDSVYLRIYDTIEEELYGQKQQYPNVDGINGALLSSLGFKSEHGVGLFLMSRTIGMLAHLSEEKENPPWSAWSSLVGRGLVERLCPREAV